MNRPLYKHLKKRRHLPWAKITLICTVVLTVRLIFSSASSLKSSISSIADATFCAAVLGSELNLEPKSVRISNLFPADFAENRADNVRPSPDLHPPLPPGSLSVLSPEVEFEAEYDDSITSVSEIDANPAVAKITVAPSSAAGYDYADKVYIKNGTNFEIDVRSYLESEIEIDLSRAEVLIVHTHASEAFQSDGEDIYIPTDTERTEDKRYNVVRLGDELAEILKKRSIGVTHIREIFDYPSYTGSYTRTLEAIEKTLKENPKIQIVIDLHRDAMISSEGLIYRPISEVDSKNAAQIMLVMGTDEGGLKHPEWRKNLVLAVHLQKFVADRYETLMRPITLSKSRYNQHVTHGSMIIEVGASGNTLQEALYSTQLFGETLCDFLDNF